MAIVLVVIDIASIQVEDIVKQTYIDVIYIKELKINTFANYIFTITISPLLCYGLNKIYGLLQNNLTLYEQAIKIFEGFNYFIFFYLFEITRCFR